MTPPNRSLTRPSLAHSLMLSGCLLLAIVIAGCSGGSSAEERAAAIEGEVNSVPRPESWEGIELLVRRQIEGAMRRLIEAGTDSMAQGRAWIDIARSYHANDLIDLALPCYERAAELNAHDAKSWYDFARLRAELGDVEGALSTLERAEANDPDHAHLAWRRGMWLLELGRLDDATAAFERAITLDAQDATGWIGLARVAAERGEHQQVIDLIGEHLATHRSVPNADYVQNLLATAHQSLGNTTQADALRVDVARRSLSWPDPWSDALFDMRRKADWIIVQADQMIQSGRPDLALQHMAPLDDTHPDDPTLMKMKAKALFALQRYDEALAIMEAHVEKFPEDIAAVRNLAFLYERIGQTAKAIEHLETIYDSDPSNVATVLDYGRLLERVGDFAMAETLYRQTMQMETERPDLFRALGRVYISLSRFPEAREMLGIAARMDPESSELKELVSILEKAVGSSGG